VPGEFYFMAVGGLGVTLAGFAGLIAALEGNGVRASAIAGWRIRHVVYQGFGVTFVAFATVALYTVTQDVARTVQVGTVAAVLTVAANWRSLSPGPAWPDDRRRRVAIVVRTAVCVVALLNVVLASVGFLQVLMLVLLTGPASTFMLAVADVTGGEQQADPDPEN
jgi:hypothetical protein